MCPGIRWYVHLWCLVGRASRVESSQSEDICSLCQLLKPELGKKEYEQASVETRLTRVLG
jgi:hypothetical protein